MQTELLVNDQEILALARYWSNLMAHLANMQGHSEWDESFAETLLQRAGERLAAFAAVVGDKAVKQTIAEVKVENLCRVENTLWQWLATLTEDQRQSIVEAWTNRMEQVQPSTDNDSPMTGIQMHHVTNGDETQGWVHTHGMTAFGLPELEMRNVPSFLVEGAAKLLRSICHYMRQPGVVISVGETMATSPRTRFRFLKSQPIPGHENHFVEERWQIVEVEMSCDECGTSSESTEKESTR